MKRHKFKNILTITCLLFLSTCLNALGQVNKDAASEKTKVKLLDSYEWRGSDDASARIDNVLQNTGTNPNSKVFIFVYCGKVCQYGEVEAHIRGIKDSLFRKKVDKQKFIIINSGFREKTVVDFWLVAENACPPLPDSTINIENVTFKGIYKRKTVPYECC